MKEETKQVVFRGTEREKAFIEARFSPEDEKRAVHRVFHERV